MQQRLQSFETLAWAKQRRATDIEGMVIVHRKAVMENFCIGESLQMPPQSEISRQGQDHDWDTVLCRSQ
jgi:hypothetical protein